MPISFTVDEILKLRNAGASRVKTQDIEVDFDVLADVVGAMNAPAQENRGANTKPRDSAEAAALRLIAGRHKDSE